MTCYITKQDFLHTVLTSRNLFIQNNLRAIKDEARRWYETRIIDWKKRLCEGVLSLAVWRLVWVHSVYISTCFLSIKSDISFEIHQLKLNKAKCCSMLFLNTPNTSISYHLQFSVMSSNWQTFINRAILISDHPSWPLVLCFTHNSKAYWIEWEIYSLTVNNMKNYTM